MLKLKDIIKEKEDREKLIELKELFNAQQIRIICKKTQKMELNWRKK